TLYEQVLPDSIRVLGEDHPDTLTSRNNLAGAYESAGRLTEAITLYEQVLPDSIRVLGEDHSLTKMVRENLKGAKRKLQQQEKESPAD
ncbi:tetratricopeptide repeat protein, partial [Actinomyces sp.]|uniref:tetratricopeptide repeat protein n=1 Tax=Actinomyces sp. TaxID=29317 RepID=UPI0025C5F003